MPGAIRTQIRVNTGTRSETQARLLVAAVAAGVVLVDALSKRWALAVLGPDPVRVMGDLLQFWLTENSGAAFGLFRNGGVLLGVIAIAALVWIVWYAGRVERTAPLVGLGLIAGGALGNLADRIFRTPGLLRGDVVDFIKLPNWPTFNLADVFVLSGVVLVVLTLARSRSEDDEHVRAE